MQQFYGWFQLKMTPVSLGVVLSHIVRDFTLLLEPFHAAIVSGLFVFGISVKNLNVVILTV